jgi:hypothetical protein
MDDVLDFHKIIHFRIYLGILRKGVFFSNGDGLRDEKLTDLRCEVDNKLSLFSG